MSFMTVAGQDYCLNLVSARETAVPSYYVALCLTMPGITTAGSELDEPTGLGYQRAEIQNYSGNWDVMHGQLNNVTDADYPVADEDWGLVKHWALTDSPVGGRVFWVGDFTDPMFISEGEQVTIPASAMAIYFRASR